VKGKGEVAVKGRERLRGVMGKGKEGREKWK